MNLNKFTEKSLAAVQEAQSIAARHSNQAVDEEHIVLALCQAENGLIPQLLTKMSVDAAAFTDAVQRAILQAKTMKE
jgi:ATP-dependent Clp protease ATP-binding subunit ClpB